MADTDNVVRTITIRGKAEGLDQLTAQMKHLVDAQGNVVSISEKQSKSTSDLDAMTERYRKRLEAGYAQTQQFGKVQRELDMLKNAGRISGDQYNSMLDKEASRLGQNSALSQAFGKQLNGVKGQMVALATGAGPVGVFLSGLGFWGMAAAVGLGAVEKAINFVNAESTRMGEKAIEMRHFSEVTGLTIGEISSLKHAAAEFGISGDSMQTAFQRLTFNLDSARKASGPLYEELRSIAPELAEQIRLAKGDADAITILGNAYKTASDQSTRALIAGAAFGKRQGLGLGPVLGAVGDAGGMENMARKSYELSAAIEHNIDTWAKLQAQIEETKKRGGNIFASIFTTQGLQAQLYAAQTMERLAKAAKDYADQTQRFPRSVALYPGAILSSPEAQMGEARLRLQRGLDSNFSQSSGPLSGDQAAIDRWNTLSNVFTGKVSPATTAAAKSLKELQDAAAGDAHLERERIGLLGSAATIEEHRTAKLMEMNSALLLNKLTQGDYNRALAAEATDERIRKMQAEISVLGALATPSQQYAQKLAELAQKLDEGKISQDAFNRATQQVVLDVPIDALKRAISALGGAATPLDHYTARVAELKNQLDSEQISKGTFDKAMTSAALDKATQQTQNYLSAIGPLATVEQQLVPIRQKIAAENLKNAGVTDKQADSIENITRAQIEWSHINEAAGLGVYDLGKAQKAASDEIDAYNAKLKAYGMTALDAGIAQTLMNDKMRQAADTAALAATPFKQLKQIELDALNTNKLLDTAGANAIHSVTSALTDYLTKAKTFKESVQALGQGLARSAIETTLKVELEPLLSKGLQTLFSKGPEAAAGATLTGAGTVLTSAGGLLSTAAGALAAAATSLGASGVAGIGGSLLRPSAGGVPIYGADEVSSIDALVAHTGGIVGGGSLATRYIHPAYFDNAPKFGGGGIVGGEVPIIAHRGEGVFTPGQMKAMGGGGSGGGDTHVTQHIYVEGATGNSEVRQMVAAGVAAGVRQANAYTNKTAASAQYQNATGVSRGVR